MRLAGLWAAACLLVPLSAGCRAKDMGGDGAMPDRATQDSADGQRGEPSPGDGDDALGDGEHGVDAGDGALETGPCVPEGEKAHMPMPGSHVDSTAGIMYNSNPPSSGPHCPSWGRYATFTAAKPLPPCNYLHNLEHGAVVLLYNCPAPCPGVVADLQAIIDAAPADPDCPSKRLLLSPYVELDGMVAGVAWGYTWKSKCLDTAAKASLAKFIVDRWGSRGMAPEPTACADGDVAP